MSEKPPQPPRLRLTVVAIIGIVWMMLSGLCTANFIGIGLASPRDQYAKMFFESVLVIGSICFLPGLLMFLFGRKR